MGNNYCCTYANDNKLDEQLMIESKTKKISQFVLENNINIALKYYASSGGVGEHTGLKGKRLSTTGGANSSDGDDDRDDQEVSNRLLKIGY